MTKRLSTELTPLPDLRVLHRHPIGDSRGLFERLFCDDELSEWLGGRSIRPGSRSQTSLAGTVRGMHFQYAPHAEAKMVICLQGRIFDVAVDLRRESRTFRHGHGEILSGENCRGQLIPEGFAHGFQTLVENCQMLYFMSAPYVPAAEGGLHPCDPRLAIRWPLPIAELSARDEQHLMLTPEFRGFRQCPAGTAARSSDCRSWTWAALPCRTRS